MWKISFEGIVTRVFPRSLVRSMRKVDDEIKIERDPEQWYLQVGDISFQVGDERPLAQVGDLVNITIQKIPGSQ